MEFMFNDQKWLIKEVEEFTIKGELQKFEENPIKSAFGLCNYQCHVIWINKDMCYDQKVQTLTHELTHCYLWALGIRLEEYPEEMVCDMMYGLMLFVNAVVDKWKENKEKE